jgi:putative SOS response-associated peptidase YedK
MCAQFTITFSLAALVELLGIHAADSIKVSLPERVLPYREGPIVREHDGVIELEMMQFSLVPAWSTTPRVKFATHNARFETITEKPTWRGPLAKSRAIVPLSGFIEPIYSGAYAGSMIEFREQDNQILLAAALYDTWRDTRTEKAIHSFAIITGEPSDFVREMGHDRQPIFLEREQAVQWLGSKDSSVENSLSVLMMARKNIALSLKVDRPLKSGWEKRRA